MIAKLFYSFRSFVSGPGRSILFTCLFYTLWLVIHGVSEQSFELHGFPGRMIGTATLEGYDVGARVSLFYRSITILLLVFPLLLLLGYFISTKSVSLLRSVEASGINYTALAGCVLFLFQVFDVKITETIEIIYFIHKFLLLALIVRMIFFKTAQLTVYHYAGVLIAAFSLYFFVADCCVLSGAASYPDIYLVAFSIAIVLMLALFALQKVKRDSADAWLYALAPLAALPLASLLKDEVFVILKAQSVQGIVYTILLLIIAAFIAWRYRKAKTKLRTDQEIIFRSYFPLFVFSMISYTLYSVFANYSGELFESGNIYLPIMEYRLFGVIPTFEKLSSHLLSDYFLPSIYTLFNGMHRGDMQLYDFLLHAASYTFYYYLILYISRNGFVALFSILIFPFAPFMMTDGYFLGVLAIMYLHRFFESPPAFKSYLLLVLLMAGLVFWRIDLGYTCVVILPLIILFYHFTSSRFKISWPLLFKAVAVVLAAVVLLFSALSLYRHQNLFEKVLYALNYFSSAQTWGYTSVGWANQPAYKMHYFIFPAMTGIILIALLLQFRSLNHSKPQRLAYLSLVFLCAFYFINFNRGLIRHSLIEGTDAFVSAYIYIIIPAAAFLFMRQNRIAAFVAFCVIAFFMVSNYRVPDAHEAQSLFEACVFKTKSFEKIDLAAIKSRVKADPENKPDKSQPFTEFIAKNTSGDETFIDFTNNPMLYFYTQKITPSYFYQNPSCTHNEFLQKKFIADLKDYNAPYLLYAEMNDRGYDHVDGVPNSLRHYRMAEYFYNNYAPYVIVGSYCVWKKNNVKDQNKKDTLYSYLQGLPQQELALRITSKPSKKYIVSMVTAKKPLPQLKLKCGDQVTTPRMHVMSETQACCVLDLSQDCEILLSDTAGAVKQLTVLQCDYIPDAYYSDKFLYFDFKKLPYLWGTYDKSVHEERVLFSDPKPVTLQENKLHAFNLPPGLDKSTGNTLLVTCKNTSRNIQHLHVFFGNSEQANKTLVGFELLPGKEAIYAIRLSSIYKWYSGHVNQAGFFPDINNAITISHVKITKGN